MLASLKFFMVALLLATGACQFKPDLPLDTPGAIVKFGLFKGSCSIALTPDRPRAPEIRVRAHRLDLESPRGNLPETYRLYTDNGQPIYLRIRYDTSEEREEYFCMKKDPATGKKVWGEFCERWVTVTDWKNGTLNLDAAARATLTRAFSETSGPLRVHSDRGKATYNFPPVAVKVLNDQPGICDELAARVE